MKLVTPSTFVIGMTEPDLDAIFKYLRLTGQVQFMDEIAKAVHEGVSLAECLCSFYAKLCYASLCTGHNLNIDKTRSIKSNVLHTLDSAHGSVFEHVNLNFVTTNCSRVLTHELIRHRAGTAFSQTSGRYVRTDVLDFVMDPILEPVQARVCDLVEGVEDKYQSICEELARKRGYESFDKIPFDEKKKLTSALRRLLPNGQANEIGWSMNIRALRHTIMMRTSRHAEWEIRMVFNQVFDLVSKKFPLLFTDAKCEEVDNALEITGMKVQPYQA